jgi:glyoxylase-like metal-dependent hydrolase (beta-lactamase superfamily II)
MQVSGTAGVQTVTSFQTAGGGEIFQLPLELFPGFWGFAYLVLVAHQGSQLRVLIDTGSGMQSSNDSLIAGLQKASELAGQDLSLERLTHIFITHGHIDHFGGLAFVRPRTTASLGVHELDLRILTNYEERLVVVGRRLQNYLVEAGVEEASRQNIIAMYLMTKGLFSSVTVDFTYEAAGMRQGPFEFLHTPGHCAGHVIIRLHDVIFTGDHILESTSPHQSPEHLTLSTGLEHYLNSLRILRDWIQGVKFGLGGHKDPIHDLPGRIEAIEALHAGRLQEILDSLSEPRTVAEISKGLFGQVHGYNILLALEETGAHVEYLYQRGLIGIANVQELEASSEATAVRYRRLNASMPRALKL